MAYGGLENYGKSKSGITPPSPGGALSTWNSNNNMSLDQASLFNGGRIYGKVGAFIQATYQDSQRTAHWDNADIRYADTGNIGDHLILYGITINNNPTVQDVWQTVPSWIFPYASPVMAPGAPPTPTVWGAFAQHVLGTGAYLELDDAFYFEVAGYASLNQRESQLVGMTGSANFNRLHGVNPYWRLTYDTHDGEQTFELGTYGMDFAIWPGNVSNLGSDHKTDFAIDASYQRFIDDNKHIISLYGSAIHENSNLASSVSQGLATNNHLSLNTLTANASYYYNNTYGITVGRTMTSGSADALAYGNSASGKPDTSFWTFQFDVTPFGSEASYGAPYINLRLFAQYTLYDKYFGAAKNYDGNGANARDNNTFFVGVWTAF